MSSVATNGSASQNTQEANSTGKKLPISVVIYVADHCGTCEYSYEVAETIRHDFPLIDVRMVNLQSTSEEIPEAVFATPTYLLNGRVWSLGNPSPEKVSDTLSQLVAELS